MDARKSLRDFLKRNANKLPWGYGFSPERVSSDALAVFGLLPIEDRLMISRHNPMVKERNAAICRLRQTGCPFLILGQLSGLSTIQVKRIAATKRRRETL